MAWRKGKRSADSRGQVGDIGLEIQQNIFDQVEEGLVLINPDRKIEAFNRSAQRMTGWTKNDALGLNFKTIVSLTDASEQDYRETNHPLDVAIRNSTAQQTESYLKRQDPEPKLPIAVTVSPIRSQAGAISHWVIVLRDQSTDHARNAAKTDFISTASHEMRTPLATIEGYLALVANPQICQVDDGARYYIDHARAAVITLSNLFRDLLTASQSEDGRMANHPRPLNLTRFIPEFLGTTDFYWAKRQLEFEFKLGKQQVMIITESKVAIQPDYFVYVDPERVRELLTNLLDNAAKYTPEGGKVELRLEATDEIVSVIVADTGIGIDPQDLPHLFQKFYRVNNEIPGTGLGLFICKQIIDLYGGKISAASQLGHGTVIRCDIPRIERSAVDLYQAQNPTQDMSQEVGQN